MDTISYIILLQNQKTNLDELANSIKASIGDFRREYIIVNDGAIEKKNLIAEAFSILPRVTIVSNDILSGPAYSINIALKLATGKYLHLIDGDEIITPEATIKMLTACKSMGTSAACGLYGTIDENNNRFNSPYDTGDIIVVDSAIKAILDNSVHNIRNFGNSGTLILRSLLEEMGGVSESSFLHNMSLALRCAKYTKFAFVKTTLAYCKNNIEAKYDKEFIVYNELSAILDFILEHRIIAENYTSEIYKALWSALWTLGNKYKVQTMPKYFLSRYMQHNLDFDTLIDLYKGYISNLEL
ncbi:MAG UNVERIFIED_CONTAM: glycosyltransferase [Rickettsiaceae bacterium]